MTTGIRKNLVTLALAFTALSSFSAHGTTLIELYERALDEDASIRAARATLSATNERLPQAKAQLLPSVQANLSRNYNNLDTTAPNAFGQQATANSVYVSEGKTLTVRMPLYNAQRTMQVEQARDILDDAQAVYERGLQDLVVRVGGAYMEALLNRAQLQLVLSQKESVSTLLDAAVKALASGQGTRTDIDDAQARFDLVVASELEVRQSEDYNRRQLEILTNDPVDALAPLDLEGFRSLPVMTSSLSDWTARAEEFSPELKSLRARVLAAEKEIYKAEAGHKPQLDAVVQWSDSGNENITRPNTRFVNKSYGVQLNIPLFQGGLVTSQVRQAIAEKTRAEELLEVTRRELNLRIHREYRGVTEGVLKVRALEQAVQSATQLVYSTKQSRQAGVRTTLDVLNAQTQLAQASRDLMQARYTYLMSRLRLASLAGTAPEQVIAELSKAFAKPLN
jgi:protease secretion system outer membrane protein